MDAPPTRIDACQVCAVTAGVLVIVIAVVVVVHLIQRNRQSDAQQRAALAVSEAEESGAADTPKSSEDGVCGLQHANDAKEVEAFLKGSEKKKVVLIHMHNCAACVHTLNKLQTMKASDIAPMREVEVNSARALTMKLGVRGFPTLVSFDEAGKEVDRMVGFDAKKLVNFVKPL